MSESNVIHGLWDHSCHAHTVYKAYKKPSVYIWLGGTKKPKYMVRMTKSGCDTSGKDWEAWKIVLNNFPSRED